MIKITDKAKCSGCHACYSVCPKNCITMKSDEEGFKYPSVDESLCIDCGLCERVCPIISQTEPNDGKILTAFAAINKCEDVRAKSSSGGVFSLLANNIISKGGVVFGAAFNDDFKVEHIAVERLEDLEKLRRSKYVQSQIGESYLLAKEFLECGRMVLFTGTPCQIGGLKAYINKDYENLICQDIICHGVPSPLVWEKYKQYRAECDNCIPQKITFRDKSFGWKSFCVRFDYTNGSSYIKKMSDDLYMKVFLKNFCLRPSCYDCNFKTLSRHSDITLADFWGIQKVLPEMDDNKGTSLVLLHSKKGENIFNEIKDSLLIKETDAIEAVKHNTPAIKSVSPYSKRRKFISEMCKNPFDKVAIKHLKVPFITRCKRFVKRIIFK